MPNSLLEKSKQRRLALLSQMAEKKSVEANRSIDVILPRIAARVEAQMLRQRKPRFSLAEPFQAA